MSAPKEMYREQYGEYAYWCYSVKVKKTGVTYISF